MGLFDKHGHVKQHGYEVYKKTSFLLDIDTYRQNNTAFELCMHDESKKEEGDLLVGTFTPRTEMISYLPRYVNSDEIEKIKNIMKTYYRRRKDGRKKQQ